MDFNNLEDIPILTLKHPTCRSFWSLNSGPPLHYLLKMIIKEYKYTVIVYYIFNEITGR